MIRLPAIIFIVNLILVVSCSDPEEPASPKADPLPEESLSIQEGATINGRSLKLNSENSQAVDFGDMYDIKLSMEGQSEHKNNSYEIRLYIVRSAGLSTGVKKYSIQNFSPSRLQISIGLSCIAEIIYQDTIYYGYEGSVSLLDHQNGKMDILVDVKAESLKGVPLELQSGIIDLKITAFKSLDCYVDKVVSPYNNGVIARYYYTSEGTLKYVHFGGEDAGEAFYFSYLHGVVKEFWHSMTLPQRGHIVMKTGIVNINALKRIESINYQHFNYAPANPSPTEVQNFFYNETGQLQKVESHLSGGSPTPSITEFRYSGKNVIERKWVSFAGTAILKLENYDDKLAPSRRIHNRVHENFFFLSLFKFDRVYLSLSQNNFGYINNNVWGRLEEASFTYKYDGLGNTIEINNSLSGTSKGFTIS